MHLVAALCSGIVGAEGGSARLYRRGTTSRATWYADFEASSSNSSGADIALDEYGAAVVYVNDLVDIFVYDSNGMLKRQFTVGAQASAVEVISPSFVGTDYETGQVAANKPALLSAILDLWKTSSGSVDFNVLIGGAATTLQNAFNAFSGFFVNVKSAEYGALGNGVADDSDAIQAAVDAAEAAGGGTVFFPAGTYRVTEVIVVPDKVSLLGAGSSNSTIRTDHATAGTLEYSDASTSAQFIQGLRLDAAQANSGARVYAGVAVHLVVLYAFIGGDLSNGFGLRSADAGCIFVVVGCTFSGANGGNQVLYAPSSPAVALGCEFVTESTGPPIGVMVGLPAVALGCRFDGTGPTTGSWTYAQSVGDVVCVGNLFKEPSTGASIAAMTGSTGIYDIGNSFEFNLGGLAPWSGSAPRYSGRYQSGLTDVQDDGASLNVSDGYAHWRNRRTTNADQTLVFPTAQWRGQEITLVYHNDSALAIATLTFTNLQGLPSITNLVANSVTVVHAKVAQNSAGLRWYIVDFRQDLAET